MNQINTSAFAIPFITYNEQHGFQLNPQAQQFLTSLPENRQLGVISIVGKYRTGKSFFVNRVLLQQTKGGFQVGPTINPCTKGLWLWRKTVKSPSNPNMDIVLIDTQGFGGMDQNANHDSRIFLFSLLLSSFFIYNSVGSIDQNALNTLNLIINLAKDIQTKTNNHNSDHNSDFPSFLWIVRDFTLQIVDKIGAKITSKEYLQNALDFQKGNSEAVQNKNKMRKLFKQYFTDRDCFTLVRPVEREKDLQRLDQMQNSLLRPEFVEQTQIIRDNIYRKVKPKNINNKILNGNLLITLCKGYMQAINKGLLPNVQSAWFYVCRSEGLKGIKQASDFLESQIEQMLKNPIKKEHLLNMKKVLQSKIRQKFQKRTFGVQEGHCELITRLQEKITQGFQELERRNQTNWITQYRQSTQNIIEKLKKKVYADKYDDFSDFIKDFETSKQQYNVITSDGDAIQKWRHFNQLSQNLYRLAGQSITKKINDNLNHEKNNLKQKLQQQQSVLQKKVKQTKIQKQTLTGKIEELEKANSRLQSIEQTNNCRVDQYKNEYDTMYEKYKNIYNQHEQTLIQVQKMKKQIKRINQKEFQQNKNETNNLKSSLEKERTLFQMQKKYLQEEITRIKDRANILENQHKKTRTSLIKLSSEYEELENKYDQKMQQCQAIQQTNRNYSRKIENLLQQNSKKSQIMGDHSEWLLQKSYLQNQVSFLKSTLNQNKKLHDALLVALQQSIASSEGDCNNELVQANKNISLALQKVQARCRLLQQKYDRLKQYKKLMKNTVAMQCRHCNQWIESHNFNKHSRQCMNQIVSTNKTEPQEFNNKQNIHVTVSQIILREGEDRKKPYTQYSIQLSCTDSKWKINKKYKQFIQLQQSLIAQLPSIKYPKSCNFLADINTLVSNKKNVMAEERRKSLQQYLRDLLAIEQVRSCKIFKQFLQINHHHNNKSSCSNINKIKDKGQQIRKLYQ